MRCSTPAVPGRVLCALCAEKQSARGAEWRTQRIAEAKCICCPNQALPGRRTCAVCAPAEAQRVREWRAAKRAAA